jgi:hypothetical protein
VKRTRVSRNAKIIVPRRSPVIFCTVENITSGGACLKLASAFGVPQTFDLTFEHGRTRRWCRISLASPSARPRNGGRPSASPRPLASQACMASPVTALKIPQQRRAAGRCPRDATAGDRRL